MPKRTDSNQKSIVDGLRRIGCSVAVTSMVGKGFVDVIVGRNGINYLLEIKDGSRVPSERRLTPDEQEFHKAWRGKVYVVNSLQEAVDIVNGKK